MVEWLWDALGVPENWMPRIHCVLGDVGVIVRSNIGNAAQGVGYIVLAYHFWHTRADNATGLAMVAFLLLCMAYHVGDSLMFWVPAYNLLSWIGLVSGISALAAAVWVRKSGVKLR